MVDFAREGCKYLHTLIEFSFFLFGLYAKRKITIILKYYYDFILGKGQDASSRKGRWPGNILISRRTARLHKLACELYEGWMVGRGGISGQSETGELVARTIQILFGEF